MKYWQEDGNTVYHGNVVEELKLMPSDSVHCCVTSPPYWGLRDYGIPPVVWDDCDCEHVWGDEQISKANDSNRGIMEWTTGGNPAAKVKGEPSSQGQFCIHCNAWRGSLGLEPTPDLFISHIVQVFREVRRVLHPSGCCFVNLGSSYAGNNPPPGYKAKDLIDIPGLAQEALRQDGWYSRSKLPWLKRSSMPESATDRPSSALEYVFQLTKSARYYFDMDAVRIPHKPDGRKQTHWNAGPGSHDNYQHGDGHERWPNSGRNFRNTDLFYQSLREPHGMIFAGDELVGIDCNPQALKAAHFASFPEKFAESFILAGCPKDGVVLDPFFGAGTVGVVAHKHGRKFTGVEISSEYLDTIAIPRVKKAMQQRMLWE